MAAIIGFHDFFTSLKIRHWWMKPFSYFAKCQHTNDLVTSLATVLKGKMQSDICLDMRVYYDPKAISFKPAHGSMSYKWPNSRHILGYLNTLEDLRKDGILRRVYIRFILEREGYEEEFKFFCKGLEDLYPDFIFFGGVCKKGWVPLYKFKNDDNIELRTLQYVGSMASDARWYERFIPILYAKRMNAKNLQKLEEFNDSDTIVLFDFIN